MKIKINNEDGQYQVEFYATLGCGGGFMCCEVRKLTKRKFLWWEVEKYENPVHSKMKTSMWDCDQIRGDSFDNWSASSIREWAEKVVSYYEEEIKRIKEVKEMK